MCILLNKKSPEHPKTLINSDTFLIPSNLLEFEEYINELDMILELISPNLSFKNEGTET